MNLGITRYAAMWLDRHKVGCVLTRDGDEDVSLQRRCEIANEAGATCFVSIHCNASENPCANGLEVYYFEDSRGGFRLANLLCMNIVKATEQTSTSIVPVKAKEIPPTAEEAAELNNRGVKVGHYYVLKYTAMPAALVEVAFISNPTEEAWLESARNQELVGKAIARAICQYLGVKWVDQVTPEQAIDWLASKGVISAPDYWKTALLYVKNLDTLFVKLYQAFNRF